MSIYTGNDISPIPKTSGVYALIRNNKRASRTNEKVIYIGYSNELRTRLKQHLVERTGTWTNGKHPVIIDTDQIDAVWYWEEN